MPRTSLQFLPADLLHSLCKWIVATAGAWSPPVAINYAGDVPRSLFRGMLDESNATDPATVLRQYSGPELQYTDRLPRVSIQVQTAGTLPDAVSTQVQTVFDCFLDADGEPLRSVTIPGFTAADDAQDGNWLIVNASPRQRPGVTGIDERGRVTWTFNLDLGFRKNG